MKLSHTRSMRKIVWVKTRDCKLNSYSFVVSDHTVFIAGIFFKVTPHHTHICIIPSELAKYFFSVFIFFMNPVGYFPQGFREST